MIEKIKVNRRYTDSKVFFFDEIDLTKLTNPKLVLLFGPNGIGKSTLIRQIEKASIIDRGCISVETADKKGSLVFGYINGTDNFKSRQARSYEESMSMSFLASHFDARSLSEGQSIIYSSFDLLDGLRKNSKAFEAENGEDILVLLDEIDSGLSIDNIDVLARKIKSVLRERGDVQIIMSFNSPRLLKHFHEVVSLYDGSVLTMRTDDDMAAEIRKHKKIFDKARKRSDGRPKVFD